MDVEQAMAELSRVLKPDGRIIIMFPNDVFFRLARMITFKFKEANFDYGHVHQWTHREVNSLLGRHHFSIKSSRSIPFGFWPISLHGITVGDRQ